MGKPYSFEMQQLSETYSWAINAEIDDLKRAISDSSVYPLIAVGSGGSFTAAKFAARLHFERFGILSHAMTPLETSDLRVGMQPSAAWLFSARGRNVDVLNAYKNILAGEPSEIHALCMATNSPLAAAMAKSSGGYFGYRIPSGKDGFLATNSLIATSTLLLRAYNVALPIALSAFTQGSDTSSLVDQYTTDFEQLWSRDYLLVLHGTETEVGIIDLESKFSEAALGSVNASNFRDFAHGRHHWLTRFSERTGVLCIVTDRDRQLADATMSLLPSAIPRGIIPIAQSGVHAQFASLIVSFALAGAAGIARAIDPGRPGVAAFGSSLYHLRPRSKDSGNTRAAAIARKTGMLASACTINQPAWRESYDSFVDHIQSAKFGAIVFDVDGTLIRRDERFGGIDDAVATSLRRILKSGVAVGIATGRGDGIFDILRAIIEPGLRQRVLVGAYNGALLHWLDDESTPQRLDQHAGLAQAYDLLRSIQFPVEVEFRLRPGQLTIKPPTADVVSHGASLWAIAEEAVVLARLAGLKVVRSTHSIDVLPLETSKVAVCGRIRDRADGDILAIGDMGAWPGNDFELLASPYGLSVDEVSRRTDSCWNLLKPGIRNVKGTLQYLSSLRYSGAKACFRLGAFRER